MARLVCNPAAGMRALIAITLDEIEVDPMNLPTIPVIARVATDDGDAIAMPTVPCQPDTSESALHRFKRPPLAGASSLLI